MTESTYLKCVNVHKHKCVCVNVYAQVYEKVPSEATRGHTIPWS